MPQHSSTVYFSQRLRSQGLKATPARIAVLALLARSGQPLTVEEIRNQLGKDSGDQATVYRMMHTFVSGGLVRTVDFQHGHVHYELSGETEHHHLVCSACGLVEDVEGCDLAQEYTNVLKRHPKFKTIDRHSFELFGICTSCERNASKS